MESAIEWLGVATGILAVYLLYRNNIYTWPVGFVNIGCFLWIFWNQKLYGDFAVQLIFLTIGISGWINWQRRQYKKPGNLTLKQLLLCIAVTVLLFPPIYIYFGYYTDCSYPIPEALILDLSLVGQWLTAIRRIENWIYWVAADILMFVVYLLKDLEPLALYAFILVFLGIAGYIRWRNIRRALVPATDI